MLTTQYKEQDHIARFTPEYIANSPSLTSLWDSDIKIIRTTDALATICGFASADHFMGKSNFDINAPAVGSAAEFELQFHKVFRTSTQSTMVDIHTYADKTRVVTTQKTPLINAEGKVSSICCVCTELSEPKASIVGRNIIPCFERFMTKRTSISLSLELIDKYDSLGLTKAESLSFYYVTRGLSNREIAYALHRSIRTIQDHIENIKIKTHCKKRSEIIDVAITFNLIHKVPKYLIRNA